MQGHENHTALEAAATRPANGGTPELDDRILHAVALYAAASPSPRRDRWTRAGREGAEVVR